MNVIKKWANNRICAKIVRLRYLPVNITREFIAPQPILSAITDSLSAQQTAR